MSGKRRQITAESRGSCLECTSHHLNAYGYPQLWKSGRNQNMHRVLYEEAYGEIPEGLVVRHKCDNRLCIELNHLELGTTKDNSEDCKQRGRLNTPHGENRSDAKLTAQQVKEIRASKDISQYLLAAQYGVNQSTISRIRQGKRWPILP